MIYAIITLSVVLVLVILDNIWVSTRNIDLENVYYIDHNITFKDKYAGVIRKIVSHWYNHKNESVEIKEEAVEDVEEDITNSAEPVSLQDRLSLAKKYHKYYGDLGDKVKSNTLHNVDDFIEYLSLSKKIYDTKTHDFRIVSSATRVSDSAILIQFKDGSTSAFIPDRFVMVPEEK